MWYPYVYITQPNMSTTHKHTYPSNKYIRVLPCENNMCLNVIPICVHDTAEHISYIHTYTQTYTTAIWPYTLLPCNTTWRRHCLVFIFVVLVVVLKIDQKYQKRCGTFRHQAINIMKQRLTVCPNLPARYCSCSTAVRSDNVRVKVGTSLDT